MSERISEITFRIPRERVTDFTFDSTGNYIVNDEVEDVIRSLKKEGVLSPDADPEVVIDQDINCSKAKVVVGGEEYDVIPLKTAELY